MEIKSACTKNAGVPTKNISLLTANGGFRGDHPSLLCSTQNVRRQQENFIKDVKMLDFFFWRDYFCTEKKPGEGQGSGTCIDPKEKKTAHVFFN